MESRYWRIRKWKSTLQFYTTGKGSVDEAGLHKLPVVWPYRTVGHASSTKLYHFHVLPRDQRHMRRSSSSMTPSCIWSSCVPHGFASRWTWFASTHFTLTPFTVDYMRTIRTNALAKNKTCHPSVYYLWTIQTTRKSRSSTSTLVAESTERPQTNTLKVYIFDRVVFIATSCTESTCRQQQTASFLRLKLNRHGQKNRVI